MSGTTMLAPPQHVGQRPLWHRIRERLVRTLLGISLLAVVLPVILIIILLVQKGFPAMSWRFLTTDPSVLSEDGGGIRSALLGSLYLVALTLLLSVPLGVLAAVYLTEYAKQNILTRSIRLAIVNLAGVPSVVYGLFGLGLFVYALHFGTSLLAGACTMAVLVLPMVITASEEALLTVPASFREASLALGASKWQTIQRVVLPTALPGILTGIILSIGRAAGETAPILFTCVAASMPWFGWKPDVTSPILALPYHLYIVATQWSTASEHLQWGTALVLLILVLGMNLMAMIVRSYLRRGRRW